MTGPRQMPRIVAWILGILVSREERAGLFAELEAASTGTRAPSGAARRGVWWIRQTLGVLRPRVLWRLGIRPRLCAFRDGPLLRSAADEALSSGRSLRRNARTSVAVITILGLGAGAATAMFAVLDAVTLSPLPHPEPDRLVRIVGSSIEGPALEALRQDRRLFERLAGFSIRAATVRGQGAAERVRVMPVTEDFLPLLVERAADGRLLQPADHAPGAPKVAVVSRPFWERHFGREWRPNETIELDGEVYQVVGTLPGSFEFYRYRDVDIWHGMPAEVTSMSAVGRLAIGVSAETATRDVDRRLAAAEGATVPPAERPAVRVMPMREALVDDVSPLLWLLFSTTGLVLLLSCANAANLFVARLIDRRAELTVRVVMGAGPKRLLMFLLLEGAILAGLSALVGLALAWTTIELASGVLLDLLPRGGEIALDLRVLGFSVLMTTLTVIAFAFGPALMAARQTSLIPSNAAKTSAGRRVGRMRSGLVVLQVAVALVLAVGTSLLVRAFVHLSPTAPGFDVEGRYVAQLDLPATDYADPARSVAFVAALGRELQAIPTVRRAVPMYFLPLTGLTAALPIASVDGRELEGSVPYLHLRGTMPGLLDVLGIPLVAGTSLDALGSGIGFGVVVNESAARRLWPDGGAVGRRLSLANGPDGDVQTYRVVGVAADTRMVGSDLRDRLVAYVPFATSPSTRLQVLIEAERGNSVLREDVEAAIALVDPGVPIEEYQSLQALIGRSVRLPRFQASVMSALGGLGLFLAVAGCFTVLSYLVSARRREMGIRMALGASSPRIVGLVVRHGSVLVAAGLGLGLAVSLASSRLLSGFLYGISPLDPASFSAAILVLTVAAGAALTWPALAAMRVPPASVLRDE